MANAPCAQESMPLDITQWSCQITQHVPREVPAYPPIVIELASPSSPLLRRRTLYTRWVPTPLGVAPPPFRRPRTGCQGFPPLPVALRMCPARHRRKHVAVGQSSPLRRPSTHAVRTKETGLERACLIRLHSGAKSNLCGNKRVWIWSQERKVWGTRSSLSGSPARAPAPPRSTQAASGGLEVEC